MLGVEEDVPTPCEDGRSGGEEDAEEEDEEEDEDEDEEEGVGRPGEETDGDSKKVAIGRRLVAFRGERRSPRAERKGCEMSRTSSTLWIL